MKIIDEMTNKSLSNITILLEKSELTQLIGYLEDLSSEVAQNEHYHLNNDDYSKEITIAVYDDKGSLEHFAEKYKKIIVSDE